MSAADSLHPQQLKLFMRPHEIMGMVAGSVEAGDRPTNVKAWMHTKLREAQMTHGEGQSLYHSVKEHGVKDPVILSTQGPDMTRTDHFWIGNGHHRLASATEAEKETGREQYIPVIHDDNLMGSRDTYDSFPGVPRL